MRRREFITLLGAAACPFAARAQQTTRLLTIGFLGSQTQSDQKQWTAAFVQRLRELGWVEGRTVAIEYRWAESKRSPHERSDMRGWPYPHVASLMRATMLRC
jgi:putative ABC transport system substrate-binding protein